MHTCFPSGAEEAFGHLKGRSVRFLEIGTFEWQSACWMLDNILTHPMSLYVGIELSFDRYKKTLENLTDYPSHKRGLLCGDSRAQLEALHKLGSRFDGIYVDGDHREESAYFDAKWSWELLNPGGVILFDDYTLKESSIDPTEKFNVEGAVQRLLSPLSEFSFSACPASNGYQYIVRKV